MSVVEESGVSTHTKQAFLGIAIFAFVYAAIPTFVACWIYAKHNASSTSLLCFAIATLMCQLSAITTCVAVMQCTTAQPTRGSVVLLGILATFGGGFYAAVTWMLVPALWAICTAMLVVIPYIQYESMPHTISATEKPRPFNGYAVCAWILFFLTATASWVITGLRVMEELPS